MVGLSDRSFTPSSMRTAGRPVRARAATPYPCTNRSLRPCRIEHTPPVQRLRPGTRPSPVARPLAAASEQADQPTPCALRNAKARRHPSSAAASAIARPVIGMEAVRGVRVDDELDLLPGRLRRVARRLGRGHGNTGIGAAIETEQRRVELARDRSGAARLDGGRIAAERAVPGDGRLQVATMGVVEPDRAAAATPAHHAEAGGIALGRRCRPGDRGIEVADPLGIGRLGDHVADDDLRIGHLREVALTGIELRRHRAVPGLGQPPADVLDIFVDAEDLFDHEHQRERAGALRHRAVARHRTVGCRDLHLAGLDPRGIGMDHLRFDRRHGEGQAADQARHHEAASRKRRHDQTVEAFRPAVDIMLHLVLLACRPAHHAGGAGSTAPKRPID